MADFSRIGWSGYQGSWVERLGLWPGDRLDIVAADGWQIEVAKDERRDRALDAIRARRWALPTDYRFDRDEANAR